MTFRIPDPDDCTAADRTGGNDAPGAAARFIEQGEVVLDADTGLIWTRSANPLGAALTWQEALDAVAGFNRDAFLGARDWRMPNRRELRSLICHGAKQPALPTGHPFRDVFLGWVWTSTTKAGQTGYAWNVHLEGGRLFYSRKDEFRLLWPVRGTSDTLSRTGQNSCFGARGEAIPCPGTGQDADLKAGEAWPSPRFTHSGEGLLDRLTGLCWLAPQLLPERIRIWHEAVSVATSFGSGWRLPNINELESLVDADRANPALPLELAAELALPVALSAEGFWSATTSGFDPAWAFVLYVQKGAVGVGFKPGAEFHVWPVREAKP
ncbi:MAG: DUF1566 domain-containing protein [Humidesulfovibrio sp.]|uniref:Lcl C-terminal domain-containing protein n=1 Tax=Humidesulfovibrio sp. TaxID=2910988 RepID=UPI0027FE01AA|nr:DUF1566 domain-containing protein [Humidesulfovibrio sp.]MDQ7834579.1 DUF1566 domain-containing protein [Humidesulfovibrio sp.]